jgi:hypothetical protein
VAGCEAPKKEDLPEVSLVDQSVREAAPFGSAADAQRTAFLTEHEGVVRLADADAIGDAVTRALDQLVKRGDELDKTLGSVFDATLERRDGDAQQAADAVVVFLIASVGLTLLAAGLAVTGISPRLKEFQ